MSNIPFPTDASPGTLPTWRAVLASISDLESASGSTNSQQNATSKGNAAALQLVGNQLTNIQSAINNIASTLQIAASQVVSGVFSTARIPSLDASQIVSGVFSSARIPALGYLPTSGGTVTGDIYIPNATPVTVSYVSAWINGDGRLGKTASARKYKEDIERYEGSVLGITPVIYSMKEDPNHQRLLGVIADDSDSVEPLLTVREGGEIESFRYEVLAVGLLREVQRLAARVEELEAEKKPRD